VWPQSRHVYSYVGISAGSLPVALFVADIFSATRVPLPA
jgi:hypothetical protein